MIVECKAEMRGLDQELIMTKIEMALLKCQIEETNLEKMIRKDDQENF